MGEYYMWVNVDKREYIDPIDFDCGCKVRETMGKKNILLYALHTLLGDEWKGDHILWFGDERSVSNQFPNSIIQTLYNQSEEFGDPGDAYNMICESYRNVSCLFKEAEMIVREEIGFYLEDITSGEHDRYNAYGVDLEYPFEGLFIKHGKRYKYTINHTKKVYYSLDETLLLNQNHKLIDYLDPLPMLMGYGRVAKPGEWLGDIIGVSDQRPEDYSLLKELYDDW